MKPRALPLRARRILDKLDERIEKQTLLPGADAPHCVACVGIYHHAAGKLEREGRVPVIFRLVRDLLGIVKTHATMVALRAAYLRNRKS